MAGEPNPAAVSDFVTAVSAFASQIGDGNTGSTALVAYFLLFLGVAKAQKLEPEEIQHVMNYAAQTYDLELIDGSQRRKLGN